MVTSILEQVCDVITEAKREARSATHRRAGIVASDVPTANSSSSSVATTINDENAPPNKKRAMDDLRHGFLPLGQCRAMTKTTTNNNATAAELLPSDEDPAMPSYYAAPKSEFGWGGDEASKKRSGQLIAVLENHREVICTVRFSECEPVEEDDDDRKLHARREVPCASLPVDVDDDVGLGRGEVPYATPSTDEDNGDQTKQAMLCEKESDDEVPCASLSADEDDCNQKLPAARPAVLSMDTVMEIIHLESQQSNAFEKPTISVLGACWGTEELGWNERSRKQNNET